MLKYAYKFSDKKLGSGAGLKYPLPGNAGFVWVHLVNPSRDEVMKVSKDFNINLKLFEKYKSEKRTRRYSFNPLVFALVDYYMKKGRVEVENVLYALDRNFLVTVTPHEIDPYEEFYDTLTGKLKEAKPDVAYLFYEIFRADVETNFEVLAQSEKRISELEERIVRSDDLKERLRDVISQKRNLMQMWRRFWESSKLVFTIKYGLTPLKMTRETMRFFDDIHDTYVYQMQMVSIQREALTDALTINETVIANNLAKTSNSINVSVKRLTWVMLILTGVGTVLTVPNTVATIAGALTVTDYQVPFFLEVLAVSTLLAIAWFYLYWRKVHKDAE